ncbi:uncharacterized protein EV420DRAFT_1481861 [Desarmillaria tabescens]|uniref:Uncharacterized protein n=1 Tax=Armillaria tabescens TaxID=1929756 RepID=A0AA39K5Z4_ARMTA|nr:uncharacterized protein EV420DRAFT_1481861 [Desarmillaria tabescens]KAK0452863.1 hypothetical protein EV420DRAFT_1481861 [Desarmillaria tabescens]
MTYLIPNIKKPPENSNLDAKFLGNLKIDATPRRMHSMIKLLAGVHPVATVAWNFCLLYSSSLFKIVECVIFIEGYAKKSGIEHLFTMDVSGQAEKFRQAFIDLKG